MITDFIFGICSGFQVNPAGKYYLNVKGPALYLVGPYKISGRVLVLPIQGEGKSNITLGNEFNRNFQRIHFHQNELFSVVSSSSS